MIRVLNFIMLILMFLLFPATVYSLTPEALEKLTHEAHLGDIEAQYALATYYESLAEKQDLALEYYISAADQGHIKSQLRLASLFLVGYSSPFERDLQTAFKYYTKAAEQNNSGAITTLGQFYQYGLLGKVDYPKAIMLYEKAAELGNSYAYNLLGQLYSGKTKTTSFDGIWLFDEQQQRQFYDNQKALFYFNKGISLGNYEDLDILSELYAQGEAGVEKDDCKSIEYFHLYCKAGPFENCPEAFYDEFKRDAPPRECTSFKSPLHLTIELKNIIEKIRF